MAHIKRLNEFVNESMYNEPSFKQWISECTQQFNHILQTALERSRVIEKFNINPKDIRYDCGYNGKLDEFEGSFWIFGNSDKALAIDMNDVFNGKIDKIADTIYSYIDGLKCSKTNIF